MAISVHRVTKRFGDFVALDDVSVDVPAGSLTVVLGPSGSGKSTLLRVIAGLEQSDHGQVFIAGEEVTKLPPQKRNVGFVFQQYAVFKHMTVWDNVAFGLKIRKYPKDEIRSRVTKLLDLVQLSGFAERYPSQLSGGQKQRMVLARALAIEPKVLLLDEPFGSLDARVRRELRTWLRCFHDEVHVTTILVTHDQEEAMELADHMVIMSYGKIEQIGPPQEIYDHPANEFVMSFVGDTTRLGDALIRTHEVVVRLNPNGATASATVERLIHLGFVVRVELRLDNGQRITAQLTREHVHALALVEGQRVYIARGAGVKNETRHLHYANAVQHCSPSELVQ
jgi:sulfate transport system ATP-binding protein